jgi:hypothetical protein
MLKTASHWVDYGSQREVDGEFAVCVTLQNWLNNATFQHCIFHLEKMKLNSNLIQQKTNQETLDFHTLTLSL